MKRIKSELITLTPQTRLYGMKLPIVAITGGVATGKSTATQILRDHGFSVICADALIKKIYKRKEVLDFLQSISPEVIQDDQINFPILRQRFFGDTTLKAKLEGMLFSFFPEEFTTEAQQIKAQDFILYDVPLLFEKKLETLVDYILCIYAPRELQLKRLLERDGSSSTVANQILKSQMDIEKKKNLSTHTIANTGKQEELKTLIRSWLKTSVKS